MNLSALILRAFGWKVNLSVPDYPKCIICVAPHTSNWDFILGELAYSSVGRKAGFLMKDTWFFWPLGTFFRAIGGVPVPRRKPGKGSLTEFLIDRFKTCGRLNLAITPEGTRSKTSNWHTGFLHIAYAANVPIVLGAIDAPSKQIFLERTFIPTGNAEADLRAIKDYYAPFKGIVAENFSTE